MILFAVLISVFFVGTYALAFSLESIIQFVHDLKKFWREVKAHNISTKSRGPKGSDPPFRLFQRRRSSAKGKDDEASTIVSLDDGSVFRVNSSKAGRGLFGLRRRGAERTEDEAEKAFGLEKVEARDFAE